MRAPPHFSASAFTVVVSAALVFTSCVALALFGVAGFGRGGMFAVDMRYLYVAGDLWEGMRSPYDGAAFKAAMKTVANIDSIAYAYPPNSSALALLLSSGSLGVADLVITTLNILSLAAIAYFVMRAHNLTFQPAPKPSSQELVRPAVAIALLVGNPFTAHVFWMGQTTLVAAGLLVTAWLLAHARRDLVAGILLGLSAFKPQLALLVGFWFLLDRRWLLLGAAAATTLLASVPALLSTGVVRAWLNWLSALSDYQDAGYNVPGFKHVFGLQSMAAQFGWKVPSLLPLAVAAVAVLYVRRGRYHGIWLVAPIFSIAALLLYAHDYDLVTVALMALPLLVAAQGRTGATFAVLALFALLFFPQRLWEHLDLAALSRLREVSVMGLLAMYLLLCRIAAASPATAAAGEPGGNSVGGPTAPKAMMAGSGSTT